MNNYRLFPTLLLSVSLLFSSDPSVAQEIRVAVASNFAGAMKKLVEDFEAHSDHSVTLSFGSTGKHFAQIKNGAPFHAFFAADIHRPQILEQEGIAVAGSRFTYAVGKLVLWSPRAGYVDASASILERGDFRFLAIANPTLAPYGKAAEEVLLARGLWSGLAGRLVRGENISQAFQFVRSGNAELGFVAYSQVQRPDRSIEGSYWEVPQGLYTPIAQQVVLLRENEAARAFLLFVRSPQASNIIRAHGYDTPR
jgi:molybdate transport system substrate-binding protein